MGEAKIPYWLAAEFVARGGRMGWADFMKLCLYHQEFGYYSRGVNFLPGTPRDFVTPPELSGLFGACVGRWVVQCWEQEGRPEVFEYVEIGGGRGTLLGQVDGGVPAHNRGRMRLVLVETSPVLAAMQLKVLDSFGIAARVVGSLGEIVGANVVVGVEVLDAFGVDIYQKRDGLVTCEELVWDGFGLKIEQAACAAPVWPADGWRGAEEAVWEVSVGRIAMLEQIKRLAAPALLIDYGYASLPPAGGRTLQAVRGHQSIGVLEQLGDADLTAHVNFGEAMAVLGREACRLENLADFLLRMGIVELGLQHTVELNGGGDGLRRLLHPNEMGTLFKALCFMPNTR